MKQIDPDFAAALSFDCLNQIEVGVLEEFENLIHAGFDEVSITNLQVFKLLSHLFLGLYLQIDFIFPSSVEFEILV